MINLDQLNEIGEKLSRPECVVCNKKGEIYVSDSRGGITCIDPDGSQNFFSATGSSEQKIHPNGIALQKDRSFLIADLNEKTGGVYHLTRYGQLKPFLEQVDGVDLPPTNFVIQDIQERTWITVSTRAIPRTLGYRKNIKDGFIILVDKKGARIVADQLGFANEVAIHPSGKWLYVNETFAKQLSRFTINDNGSLNGKEVVTTFGKGTFPDGIAFDSEGFAWITSIISNRIIRVAFSGEQELVLEDADDVHVKEIERAFRENRMGKAEISKVISKKLKNISSLAFGGLDLKTCYVGSLLGESVQSFPSSIAGHPPAHWNY